MKKIKEEITKLVEYINKESKTISHGKKKYSESILKRILFELDSLSLRFEMIKGYSPHEYDMLLTKTIQILSFYGFSSIDYTESSFSGEIVQFMYENKEVILKKKVDYNRLNNIRKLYKLYLIEYDEKPKKIIDLNKIMHYVSKPVEE
jgi:hypothetical protein